MEVHPREPSYGPMDRSVPTEAHRPRSMAAHAWLSGTAQRSCACQGVFRRSEPTSPSAGRESRVWDPSCSPAWDPLVGGGFADDDIHSLR